MCDDVPAPPLPLPTNVPPPTPTPQPTPTLPPLTSCCFPSLSRCFCRRRSSALRIASDASAVAPATPPRVKKKARTIAGSTSERKGLASADAYVVDAAIRCHAAHSERVAISYVPHRSFKAGKLRAMAAVSRVGYSAAVAKKAAAAAGNAERGNGEDEGNREEEAEAEAEKEFCC